MTKAKLYSENIILSMLFASAGLFVNLAFENMDVRVSFSEVERKLFPKHIVGD